MKNLIRKLLKESVNQWQGTLFDLGYEESNNKEDNFDESDGFMVRREGNIYRVVFRESGAFNENIIDDELFEDYANALGKETIENHILSQTDYNSVSDFLSKASVYEKIIEMGSIYGFSDMFSGVPTMDLEDVLKKYPNANHV